MKEKVGGWACNAGMHPVEARKRADDDNDLEERKKAFLAPHVLRMRSAFV